MKIKYTLMYLFSFLFTTLSAQSLDEAKKLFLQGEYEKSKPVFAQYVKSQPANASYNYWYGVCCLETGEAEKSVKYLEMASQKKIQNAPFYLGKAYDQVYRFEEAVKSYEEYITNLTKRKQSTGEAPALLERSKANARMLKGVEEVCVIDSFVVEKDHFLKAYKISKEAGKIYMFNDFFHAQEKNNGIVYETELGNKIYYSQQENKALSIFTKDKMNDKWGSAGKLPENINSGADTSYPYMLMDGITLYYASDGELSTGGYDIFVTRYNNETKTYLNPENIGMPFNSPFNDYMYVLDEFNNLGWFASDRFQPEGKVCIYVFVPNTSKQTYDYEATDKKQLIHLAQLHSIKETWKDKNVVAEARKRLEAVANQIPENKKAYDFTFIVDDNFVYHSINDFRSANAKDLFKRYQQAEKSYAQQIGKLENMRNEYAKANKAGKEKLTPGILDLEKRIQEMIQQLDNFQTEARNEEIKVLKK